MIHCMKRETDMLIVIMILLEIARKIILLILLRVTQVWQSLTYQKYMTMYL